ncbi:MerR family transcriptional regulator [Saccharibacillus sp. CPCC 101409]|uniref:MerR family transcriptional regulator n=1 Tax=Saccharibacillus sp. CPCC 101409 TaxID=3058041 RepID=UPI002671585E|nr:MerR family transcriptional regulator [Saccharibacillus sp. CPCC 101409]MDO3411117.1 MerR family transcriptional regulator [Saccharibacillus sp. CPCC 101409]
MDAEEVYYSTRQTIELTGLSKDTLRYYEKIGVLQHIARDVNNYRKYAGEDIEWLILIKHLRAIGIETAEFIGKQHAGDAERLDYLEKHKLKIEHNIEQLRQTRDIVNGKIAFLKSRSGS